MSFHSNACDKQETVEFRRQVKWLREHMGLSWTQIAIGAGVHVEGIGGSPGAYVKAAYTRKPTRDLAKQVAVLHDQMHKAHTIFHPAKEAAVPRVSEDKRKEMVAYVEEHPGATTNEVIGAVPGAGSASLSRLVNERRLRKVAPLQDGSPTRYYTPAQFYGLRDASASDLGSEQVEAPESSGNGNGTHTEADVWPEKPAFWPKRTDAERELEVGEEVAAVDRRTLEAVADSKKERLQTPYEDTRPVAKPTRAAVAPEQPRRERRPRGDSWGQVRDDLMAIAERIEALGESQIPPELPKKIADQMRVAIRERQDKLLEYIEQLD